MRYPPPTPIECANQMVAERGSKEKALKVADECIELCRNIKEGLEHWNHVKTEIEAL